MSAIQSILLGQLLGESNAASDLQRADQRKQLSHLRARLNETWTDMIYQASYAAAHRKLHGAIVREMEKISYGVAVIPKLSDSKNKDARGELFASLALEEIRKRSSGRIATTRAEEVNIKNRFQAKYE